MANNPSFGDLLLMLKVKADVVKDPCNSNQTWFFLDHNKGAEWSARIRDNCISLRFTPSSENVGYHTILADFSEKNINHVWVLPDPGVKVTDAYLTDQDVQVLTNIVATV